MKVQVNVWKNESSVVACVDSEGSESYRHVSLCTCASTCQSAERATHQRCCFRAHFGFVPAAVHHSRWTWSDSIGKYEQRVWTVAVRHHNLNFFRAKLCCSTAYAVEKVWGCITILTTRRHPSQESRRRCPTLPADGCAIAMAVAA